MFSVKKNAQENGAGNCPYCGFSLLLVGVQKIEKGLLPQNGCSPFLFYFLFFSSFANTNVTTNCWRQPASLV